MDKLERTIETLEKVIKELKDLKEPEFKKGDIVVVSDIKEDGACICELGILQTS